ncbi:MAG TPA: helix-turn-helix transcriptional regulator [Nitrospinota bacterium]|nr:helix-turn-helix transcriptional regulator [Nitrospinota bacterium]
MKNKLKYLRFFLGKSQEQLAQEAGLSQSQISRIERGYIKPQKEDRKKLSIILGVEEKAIFPEE